MPKQLLTTKEAAALLSITDGRVRQLLLSGELKGQKFGHVWMIDRRTIEKLARSQRKGIADPY